MKLKNTKGKSSLLTPGKYAGTLVRFDYEPKGAAEPKKANPVVQTEEKDTKGNLIEIAKPCPANLDPDSPLRTFIQALLGRPLTDAEVDGGFDPETLVGMKCVVMIVHRNGPGGREQLAIDAIYPQAKEEGK
jgi:hypothetical protein